jgi:hypothetical protein
MSQPHRPLLWLAAAGLLLAACSSPVRRYTCAEIGPGQAVDALSVWSCNVEVMQRIVGGGKFSLREFLGAAEFLEGLTGIPADVRQTPYGAVPGPDLAKSLRGWKDWYAAHAAELVWDAATGTVRRAVPDES